MPVPLPPDDCVACQAVFRANRELASLPRAQRVVVDLTHGRAWRICTACGHWNLLGPELAAATIDELSGRLPALSAERTGYDAVGAVEVLQIAMHDDAPMASRAGLLRRQYLGAARRLAHPVFLLALLPLVAAEFWALLTGGSLDWAVALVAGVSVVGLMLAGEVTALLLHRRFRPSLLGFSLFSLLILAFAVPRIVDTWMGPSIVLQIGLLYTTLLVATDTLFHGFQSVRVLDGATLRLSPLAMRDAELAVAPDRRQLVVHGLRGDVSVVGGEAVRVVLALSGDDVPQATPAVVERGWLLARSHGDLASLGRALDLARPDDAGRHLWRELPLDWRLAFAFAAVEEIGLPEEREQLRRKIREAVEVARIAERLDAPS